MRIILSAFILMSLLLVGSKLLPQSPTASITGIVFDPDNRVIAGAEIIAVNDLTGVKYLSSTNGEGIYTVVSLPPGPYRVQVSKADFKTIIKPNIVLNVGDALSLNFTLPIGASSVAVTVEGGAPLINTQSAAVSTVVDRKFVENTPLNGRSFQDLILLTPGVVSATPQNSPYAGIGETGEFSVNGQRTEANYYSVDGASANTGVAPGLGLIVGAGGPSGSVPASTALGTTQAIVSVDALEEFRVQSSSYSAEYGRNPGGQFSFVTRSGSNAWNGTLFNYLRNNAFDANDWFNNYYRVSEPALRQNDFGGTIGGPVKILGFYDGIGKTFFFFSYEGLRLTQPQAATVQYVPDAGLRQTAPAALQPVLNAFPLADGPRLGNGLADFIGSWSNPSSLDAYSARFDHNLGERVRLFFRFSDTPSKSAVRSNLSAGIHSTTQFTSRTYSIGATGTLSSRLTNDFRLNYSTNQSGVGTTLGGFAGGTLLDFPGLQGVGAISSVQVLLNIAGYQANLAYAAGSAEQRQWNVVDSGSLSFGRHQMRFGVDFRKLTPTITPYDPIVNYVFNSEANVEANKANIVTAKSLSAAYPLYQNFSAFIQDEWKLTPRLNLSMGVRWEVNPAPGVTRGLKPYTVEGSSPATLTLAPQGTPLWKTDWFSFAPRLGIVYLLRNDPSRQTVLRAGGGIFFDTAQQPGSQGFEGPGFTATSAFFGAAFPLTVGQVSPPVIVPPVAPYNTPVTGFPSHLQLPFTRQWNVSVQQALGDSQALTISYVGAHATKLLKQAWYNGGFTGNPNIPNLFFYQNGLTSDYEALQVQLQRRISEGLALLGGYTFSHCLDYGSTNIQLGYARGNCDFDIRHNFSLAVSYDLPNAFHSKMAAAIFHHWGIDDRVFVRTGFPVTLVGNSVFDPATQQLVYSGLDLVPGQPAYIYGSNCAQVYSNRKGCPGGRAINPNAFASPAAGEIGDAPRNFARGFGAWQMDFAIRRDFPLYERLKLQFRAEAFNVFNHPNFGYVNPNFGQNTFGQATGTLAATLGVLSPIYQVGGPRSLQFSLKLSF